jgi:hypothetical protein
MEVLELTATQFIKVMSSGRNRPLLLGCEDDGGGKFEVVVKLRGRELTEKGQSAELIAAQLGDDLGLRVPQAAVVKVPVGFEAVISDCELVKLVEGSSGLNFGSVHVGSGFTTWPPERSPHGAQRDQAVDVFAFDALVQNPDRRAFPPNLWVRSERIGILDHEQAFSFLGLAILGGAPKPWVAANQSNAFRFLEQHIFYRSLRGGRLNLGPFQEKVGALTHEGIQRFVDAVPAEWRNQSDFCDRIADYLREARQQSENLVNFIKHILR